MRDELFNELVESVKEGGAILRGEAEAHRETSFEEPETAQIRAEYGLSQAKFAALLGIRAEARARAPATEHRLAVATLMTSKAIRSGAPGRENFRHENFRHGGRTQRLGSLNGAASPEQPRHAASFRRGPACV